MLQRSWGTAHCVVDNVRYACRRIAENSSLAMPANLTKEQLKLSNATGAHSDATGKQACNLLAACLTEGLCRVGVSEYAERRAAGS